MQANPTGTPRARWEAFTRTQKRVLLAVCACLESPSGNYWNREWPNNLRRLCKTNWKTLYSLRQALIYGNHGITLFPDMGAFYLAELKPNLDEIDRTIINPPIPKKPKGFAIITARRQEQKRLRELQKIEDESNNPPSD